MNEVDFILGLIDARFCHLCSAAVWLADRDDHDWKEERPLYGAQADALRVLAMDIRAAIQTLACQTPGGLQLQSSCRWVLATELGGTMSATIFNDIAVAQEAKDRFCYDHGLLDDFESHAACSIETVHLPLRRTETTGGLDGRYALIIYMDSNVRAEIYETNGELEAALEGYTERFGDRPMYSCHEILVPWVCGAKERGDFVSTDYRPLARRSDPRPGC